MSVWHAQRAISQGEYCSNAHALKVMLGFNYYHTRALSHAYTHFTSYFVWHNLYGAIRIEYSINHVSVNAIQMERSTNVFQFRGTLMSYMQVVRFVLVFKKT